MDSKIRNIVEEGLKFINETNKRNLSDRLDTVSFLRAILDYCGIDIERDEDGGLILDLPPDKDISKSCDDREPTDYEMERDKIPYPLADKCHVCTRTRDYCYENGIDFPDCFRPESKESV